MTDESRHAPAVTPVTWTTRRGIATWSFCIGLWTTLVFWWYPYSVFAALTGLILGLLSLAMGWRAGKDGDTLDIYIDLIPEEEFEEEQEKLADLDRQLTSALLDEQMASAPGGKSL